MYALHREKNVEKLGFLCYSFSREKKRTKILAFGVKIEIGLQNRARKALWRKGSQVAE